MLRCRPAAVVIVAILACTLLMPLRGTAAPIVIDFESFPGAGFWAGSTVPGPSQLSDQLLTVHGVRFTSSAGWVAVVEAGSGHAWSGVNTIAGSTAGGLVTYATDGPIEASFFDPARPDAPAVTDYVSVRADRWSWGINDVTLNAYDIDGNIVASTTVRDVGGNLISVSGPGIHRIEFLGPPTNYDGVGLDDLTFNPVTPLAMEVGIDVKPGSFPSCFRIDGRGTVPVAVFGSPDVDVRAILPETLVFEGLTVRVAPRGTLACHPEHADADGYLDLTCQFEDVASAWTGAEPLGRLTGRLADGTRIEGWGDICLRP